MGNLNKVQIIGNLGRDPEVRCMPDDRLVANVSVATSERWKDQAGNQKERIEWHRVSIFGNTAAIVEKYLKKGDTVYFEGRLQTRKWVDKDGQEKYTTEIIVDRSGNLVMLGGRNHVETNAPETEADAEAPAFEDDIPF